MAAKRVTRILVAWSGLPIYAARCLKALVDCPTFELSVLATRPDVPIVGQEDELGQPIVWVDRNDKKIIDVFNLFQPDFVLHTGWSIPGFVELGNVARRAGVPVVVMSDNIWKGTIKQWLGLLPLRIYLARHADALFVPGKAAKRYMRLVGVPDDRISLGLYGADPDAFWDGGAMVDRKYDFCYVGRLIERKGIDQLLLAIKAHRESGGRARFVFAGAGPFSELLANIEGVDVHPFLSPMKSAELMRASRFFILPSREDHWGVVAHEAVCAGCGLLISSKAGASLDLLYENGILFKTARATVLLDGIERALRLDQEGLEQYRTMSLEIASKFGPSRFKSAVSDMTALFGK
jgi:glycosyltransferase involved in cell wall biosynthesis